MKRFACVVGLMLLAVPAIAQAPDKDHLITPGVGIGPVKIGMHIDDATKILGTPSVVPVFHVPPDGTTLYRWGLQFVAETDSKGVIYLLGTFDSSYATLEGLRVGSDEAEVRTKLGEPSRVVQKTGTVVDFVYASVQLSIRTPAHIVMAIDVFAPRRQ